MSRSERADDVSGHVLITSFETCESIESGT